MFLQSINGVPQNDAKWNGFHKNLSDATSTATALVAMDSFDPKWLQLQLRFGIMCHALKKCQIPTHKKIFRLIHSEILQKMCVHLGLG